MLLDFDPDGGGDRVAAVLAVLDDAGGKDRFARTGLLRPPRGRLGRRDGLPAGAIGVRPRDAAKFDATGRSATRLGWQYRLVGAADADRGGQRAVAGRLPAPAPRISRRRSPGSAGTFAAPVALMAGAQAVG